MAGDELREEDRLAVQLKLHVAGGHAVLDDRAIDRHTDGDHFARVVRCRSLHTDVCGGVRESHQIGLAVFVYHRDGLTVAGGGKLVDQRADLCHAVDLCGDLHHTRGARKEQTLQRRDGHRLHLEDAARGDDHLVMISIGALELAVIGVKVDVKLSLEICSELFV